VEITAMGGNVVCDDSVSVLFGVTKVKGADFGLSVPFEKVAVSAKFAVSPTSDTEQSIEVALAI